MGIRLHYVRNIEHATDKNLPHIEVLADMNVDAEIEQINKIKQYCNDSGYTLAAVENRTCCLLAVRNDEAWLNRKIKEQDDPGAFRIYRISWLQ